MRRSTVPLQLVFPAINKTFWIVKANLELDNKSLAVWEVKGPFLTDQVHRFLLLEDDEGVKGEFFGRGRVSEEQYISDLENGTTHLVHLPSLFAWKGQLTWRNTKFIVFNFRKTSVWPENWIKAIPIFWEKYPKNAKTKTLFESSKYLHQTTNETLKVIPRNTYVLQVRWKFVKQKVAQMADKITSKYIYPQI
jgi:hypothetical protein